ncbi:MAG: hypothetical protein Aurels2KO_33160 [Aureliella sp.]
MSNHTLDDANQSANFQALRPATSRKLIRKRSIFTLSALLAVSLAASTLTGCQGINQPYSIHGLTRVPPPGTRPNYPSTNGYYGPNNATSAIQPVGTVVANNQIGAPWNGQGTLPSTDLTATAGQLSAPPQGAVSTATFSGAPQQFDAYGQPLLRANGVQQANTWSNDSNLNASMAGFTGSESTGVSSSFTDTTGNASALPSTGGPGSDAALTYPEASNLDFY